MYQRIMVSIDGSDTSTRALRAAIQIGQHQQAAAIRLLHVVDTISNVPQTGSGSPPSYIKGLYAQARKYGQELLEQAQKDAARAGLHVETRLVELKRASDHVAQVIVDEARAMPAELIVMGTHGRRGLSHLLLGSVAEGVMRMTPCPVLLIRSE